MSGSNSQNPNKWSVRGNLVPEEVSEPTTVDVFFKNNCILALEPAVVVDGNLLIPVKSTPSW